MNNLTAISIIENIGPEVSENTYLTAWQRMIDSGLVWTKTQWHRQAIDLIATGRCRDTHNTIGCDPHSGGGPR